MTNRFLSKEEFQLEARDIEFIIKTQQQIIKDFGMSGIDFPTSFSEKTHTYLELKEIVAEKFHELMQHGETSTLQLLYQIDIPQNDFLNLTTAPNFMSEISDLIIRREAYKVYLRRKFS